MTLLRNVKAGDTIEGKFAVRVKKSVQPNKTGTFRFELIVGDASRDMDLCYWGGNDEARVRGLFNSFSKYDVVEVKGSCRLYNDALQISVNEGDLRPCKPGEYDPKEFVKVTKRDIEAMFKELKAKIDSVKNPDLRRVLDAFFDDNQFTERFKKAPAAKQYHHNHIGGLLEHTLDVTRICEDVMRCHPEVDRDLVITGALLHDVGKVDEYEVGTAIRLSKEGMLVGHIHRSLELFEEKTRDLSLPKELSIKLKHIIVSHHGSPEFGSPKKPIFPEALLIHKADDLDASLELMITQKEEAETEDDHIYTKELGFVYLR